VRPLFGAQPVARADVKRFVIAIGNSLGAAGEEPLRFAEQDALRVYEVLTDLGPPFSSTASIAEEEGHSA
jgi:hypothetical protein